MKLHILSDLHLEFGGIKLPTVDAEMTVLAGDIGVGLQGIEWALQTFDHPVVYVMGNHEFFGQRTMSEFWDRAQRKVRGTHVHLLENEALVIEDVLFLGCTLWTDFLLFGQEKRASMMAAAQTGLSDYFNISTGLRGGHGKRQVIRLTPEDTLRMHQESTNWLASRLANTWKGAKVVVTHTAPHLGSLHEKYADDPIAAAFVSDLGLLVQQADCWIHGHTHDSLDYQVGDSRVICNPRGYAGVELNPGFRAGLTVEV